MEKGKKIKVFAYCDSPTCATGFATVSRNIFEGLYRTGRYDIDVFGINYWGDPHNFPYRVWPAGTNKDKDPYGRQKAVSMIPRMELALIIATAAIAKGNLFVGTQAEHMILATTVILIIVIWMDI